MYRTISMIRRLAMMLYKSRDAFFSYWFQMRVQLTQRKQQQDNSDRRKTDRWDEKKSLGSEGKNRVGRVSGNKHFFFLRLTNIFETFEKLSVQYKSDETIQGRASSRTCFMTDRDILRVPWRTWERPVTDIGAVMTDNGAVVTDQSGRLTTGHHDPSQHAFFMIIASRDGHIILWWSLQWSV